MSLANTIAWALGGLALLALGGCSAKAPTLTKDRVYPPAFAWEADPADSQTLRCTPEHPFYVVGRGFVAAKDLRPGDRGLDAQGNEVVFTAVESRQEEADHYNFEVEDFHTYFVSETADDPGIWVHNLCKRLRGRAKKIEEAAATPGRSGVRGVVDQADANRLGRNFVGEGYRTVELPNGQTALVSANGRRMYRDPKAVSNNYTKTGRQANFQQRANARVSWRDKDNVSNVHMDVR